MGWHACGHFSHYVGVTDGNVFSPRLSRCALRGARQWGNVSSQRPFMVTFLRVYRQHLLCPLHPSALQQGSWLAHSFAWCGVGQLRPVRFRRIWHAGRGMDIGWIELLRRPTAHGIPLYSRHVDRPSFPSDSHSGGFLDLYGSIDCALSCALYRGK